MKIIRRFNVGGVWKQDFLSDEDILKVRDVLRGDNVEIMKLCISDSRSLMSKEIAETNGETMACMTAIALGLFDKLADMAFTRFQGELDERELLARGETESKKTIDQVVSNSSLIKTANQAIKEIETERDKKLKTDPEYKKAVDEKISGDTLW